MRAESKLNGITLDQSPDTAMDFRRRRCLGKIHPRLNESYRRHEDIGYEGVVSLRSKPGDLGA